MKQDLLVEYAKYISDPIFCMEQNLRVLDRTKGGFVPFRFFTQQKTFINNLFNHLNNIAKKPRQTGATTCTAAYISYKMIMATPDKPFKVIVVANKLDTAQEIFNRTREFLACYPLWMWGEFINPRKEEEKYIDGLGSTKKLVLLNGSEIKAMATSNDVGRGSSPNACVLDEMAYIDGSSTLLTSLIASLSGVGQIILLSTPKGFDEGYYATYKGAIEGKNDFKVSEFTWYNDERYNKEMTWQKFDNTGEKVLETVTEIEYTPESFKKMFKKGFKPTSPWYEKMKRNLNGDKSKIAQELDGEFAGSSNTIIESNTIRYYENEVVSENFTKTCFDDNGWCWEDPQEGHKYISGVDVSTGDGSDYSTISIFDIDEMKLVFEYQAKCSQEQLAEIVFKYCGAYKALTVVDTTGGYGDLLIHLLEEMKYKHLYYEEYIEDVKIKDTGKEIQWKKKKKKAGFKIQKYRPAAISHYASLVAERILNIPSIRHVNELNTFIWLNGRADHQGGFNDDIIMSGVAALWIAESVYNKIARVDKVNQIIKKHFIGFGVTAQDIEDAVGEQEEKKKKPVFTNRLDPTHKWDWVFGG